jgi:hypothetical protein
MSETQKLTRQGWKANRRVRPVYDRGMLGANKSGTRADGAVFYRAYPVLSRGSQPCACGRTISANKTQCLSCATGAGCAEVK